MSDRWEAPPAWYCMRPQIKHENIAAVVQRLLPAKDRVRVLLEFLGRTVETKLPAASLVKTGINPRL